MQIGLILGLFGLIGVAGIIWYISYQSKELTKSKDDLLLSTRNLDVENKEIDVLTDRTDNTSDSLHNGKF